MLCFLWYIQTMGVNIKIVRAIASQRPSLHARHSCGSVARAAPPWRLARHVESPGWQDTPGAPHTHRLSAGNAAACRPGPGMPGLRPGHAALHAALLRTAHRSARLQPDCIPHNPVRIEWRSEVAPLPPRPERDSKLAPELQDECCPNCWLAQRFCNGVDWRNLVNYRNPQIAKLEDII